MGALRVVDDDNGSEQRRNAQLAAAQWPDEPTATADADLMRPAGNKPGKVRSYQEKFPNGQTQARWSGAVAKDGRFLLQGREQWWFASGQPHYEANYELGRKVGTESLWREDGSFLWRREHQADGSTVWTQFWEDGTKKSESNWRNFKADGPARLWGLDGKLTSEVEFSGGVLR